MGQPAEPSLEDREKRRRLAALEVACVSGDIRSPFEREMQKVLAAYKRADELARNYTSMTASSYDEKSITEAQNAADQQRKDMGLMFFEVCQEVDMLRTEKDALQKQLDDAHRLLATRR